MDEMDVADDGDIPLPQQHLFLDQADGGGICCFQLGMNKLKK
jgi:hypothetical protein